jgi:hypothetical protein
VASAILRSSKFQKSRVNHEKVEIRKGIRKTVEHSPVSVDSDLDWFIIAERFTSRVFCSFFTFVAHGTKGTH